MTEDDFGTARPSASLFGGLGGDGGDDEEAEGESEE